MASATCKTPQPFSFPSTQQKQVLLILLLLLSCLPWRMPFITGTTTASNITKSCIKAERDALLTFKAQITYHSVHPISSWGDQTEDCCQWPGVSCDINSGHVVVLDLLRTHPRQYDHDDDEFPWNQNPINCDEWDLSGNISESLIGLRQLTYLYLSGNCFINISIPKFLGSLENLAYLSLSDSGFTGVIPHELGNLTRLRYLDLALNPRLKVDDAEWLSGLSSLRYLFMLFVNFSGVNNTMQSLNKLQYLQVVLLLGCRMSCIPASLPHLNFTSLTTMSLGYNKFYNTSIPEWIFRIPNLRDLEMIGCGFTGTIPSSIGNATSLRSLDLSQNTGISGYMPRGFGDLCNLQSLFLIRTFVGKRLEDFRDAFSGCVRRNLNVLSLENSLLQGPLPDWLGEFRNLTNLYLSNNSLHGSIPESLGRLSGLEYLDLSDNALNGYIPESLGRLSNLQNLVLANNALNGSIPESMGRHSRLQNLDLQSNDLSGSIPASLGQLQVLNPHALRRPELQFLSLSSNNFTGTIPNSLCNLVDLELLDFSNNHLEGAIPNCWNNLTALRLLMLANNSLAGEVPNSLINSSQSLQVLHLSNNKLHGEFPSFLNKCTSMTTLALDHNNLSGIIPSWVGETMTSLMILTLKRNNFSGNLPLLSNLTSLHFLDLSHNSFVGSIPQSYGNLKGMMNISMINGGAKFSSNLSEVLVITMDVSTKGRELQYGVSLSSFKFIDLSANNLSGQIPEDIVNLVGLQNLDLSGNHLSGEIPIDIGLMQSLESLDLSRNELNGSIPTSLSTLHFLGSLNLSHNNLSGKIPYSSQLTTLNDPSIYAGNLNLCGAPLDKNCTSDEQQSNAHDQEDDDDDDDGLTIWLCIGLMCGFVVGFWIVWMILIFKKEWRYAYFRLMDHAYDMMYVKITVIVAKIRQAFIAGRSM